MPMFLYQSLLLHENVTYPHKWHITFYSLSAVNHGCPKAVTTVHNPKFSPERHIVREICSHSLTIARYNLPKIVDYCTIGVIIWPIDFSVWSAQYNVII